MKPSIKQYFQKMVDSSVVSPEEVESTLGVPILGIIPHIERRRIFKKIASGLTRRVNPDGRWRSRLLTNFPSPSPLHETYTSILKQMLDSGDKPSKRVFLIASSSASEGTTTTATNIGIAAAQAGIPTVVVEAHNRASRLSRVFGLKSEPGLTGAIERHEPVSKLLQAVDVPDLSVITAGRPVSYPGKIWESPTFESLLKELRETFRLVLLESAPVSDYPDVSALAVRSESVLFVHHLEKVPADVFKKAVSRIEDHQKSILGVVLNDVGE